MRTLHQLVLLILGVGLAVGDRGRFGASEHLLVDNLGNFLFPASTGAGGYTAVNISMSTYDFVNARGLTLGSFGKLVTYADYFGVDQLSASICSQTSTSERREAFLGAFSDLWFSTDGEYISDIQEEILAEQTVVATARAQNVNPSSLLWQMSLTRYLKLLKSLTISAYNVDHFSSANCALTTYLTGHVAAQETARAAGSLATANLEAGQGLLLQAYAMEAFAEHFLTDMFSTGHMRTPRKELLTACSGSIVSAGMTAMRQHDEDSFNGLYVRNNRSQEWFASGDYFLSDSSSSQHLMLTLEAAAISRSEVWDAFLGSSQDQTAALVLLPQVLSSHLGNTCPLFKVDGGGNLMVRTPLDRVRSPAGVHNRTAGANIYGCPDLQPENSTCTYAAFVPEKDCFGENADVVALAQIVFFPAKIEYVTCTQAYSSHSFLDQRTNRATPTIPSHQTTIMLFIILMLFTHLRFY